MSRKIKQIIANSLRVLMKRPWTRYRLTKFVIITCLLCLAINFFIIQPGCARTFVVHHLWARKQKIDAGESYIDTDYNAIDLKVSHYLSFDYGNASKSDFGRIERSVEVEYAKVFSRYLEEKATADSEQKKLDSVLSVSSGGNRILTPSLQKQENMTSAEKTEILRRCPRRPPHIHKRITPVTEAITARELQAKFIHVLEAGGRLRPKHCQPRQRLAIIVPYRNRYEHLHILLHNLMPFLMRQQADATFFIIDQVPPCTFNRGALLNVGFLEAEKHGPFDCYIFHDVDLIPLHDQNLYRCGDNPRHFAVSLNKYDYSLLYAGYFGGVVGFSREQFMDINGNSNLYFGWGGEDDDLLTRALNKGYYATRYAPMTAEYDMIKHERDQGNEENPTRRWILNSASKRQDVEGLNTIKYHVHSVRKKLLYTWVTVSLNMTEILQTAPNYTIEDMAKAAAGNDKLNAFNMCVLLYLMCLTVLTLT